jgi:hypothetical protein
MIVADSRPLHYLILLKQIDLLRHFSGQVLVPEPVAGELSAAGAPAVVREWIRESREASAGQVRPWFAS